MTDVLWYARCMSDKVFWLSLASLITSALLCGIKLRKVYELKALWLEESRLLADLQELVAGTVARREPTSPQGTRASLRMFRGLGTNEPASNEQNESVAVATASDAFPVDENRAIAEPGSLVTITC